MKRLLLFFLLLFPLAMQAQDSLQLLPVKRGGLWGYADTSGKMVIEPQYDAAGFFDFRMAVVMSQRKSYVINSKGEKIMAADFDQLVVLGDSLLGFSKNEGWGVMSISGKICLEPEFDELYKYNNVIGYRRDTLWGYLSQKGTMLSEPRYDTAQIIQGGILKVIRGKKFGLIHIASGLRLSDDSLTKLITSSDIFLFTHDSLWGMVSFSGQYSLPCLFDTIRFIAPRFAAVKRKKRTELWSPLTMQPIDTSGVYAGFGFASLDYVKAVKKNKLCALLDSTGHEFFPPEYNDISACQDDLWYIVKNYKWGIARSPKDIIIQPRYKLISPFRSGVAVAKLANSEGQDLTCAVNLSGKEIASPADQTIFVRDNIVKVTRPDFSAVMITVDEKGNVREKTDYAILRTITVSGREGTYFNSPTAVRTTRRSANDSLSWFYDAVYQRWGMRNTFTDDTLHPAIYLSKFTYPDKGYTLVTLHAESEGPAIDGKASYGHILMGLVNDSTGNFLMKPRYIYINGSDLGTGTFKKMVRARRTDGVSGLVAVDGSERVIPYAVVGDMIEGRAVVCSGGKFVTLITNHKAQVGRIGEWIRMYNLDPEKTFGNEARFSLGSLERTVIFSEGGKWGMIDSSGKLVVPAVYDYIRNVERGTKTAIMLKNDRWGMIDTAGKERIAAQFDDLKYIIQFGSCIIRAENKDPRFGYLDLNGKLVIAPGLKQARSLGNRIIAYSENNLWGLYNYSGQKIMEPQYQEIRSFREGIAAVKKNNRWGFIDTSASEIIGCTYEACGDFSSGLARVRIKGKWGFIDKNGSQIIEAKFFAVNDFIRESAVVKNGTSLALISKSGNFITKNSFREINPVGLSGFYLARKEERYALCDNSGNILSSYKYDEMKWAGEKRLMYRAGARWGLMDTTGKEITAAVYERILPFSEGFAAVRSNASWGYIRSNGKLAIPLKYSSAISFSEGRALVYESAKRKGYIDTTGKMVFTAALVDRGRSFSEEKVAYGSRGRMYYLGRQGTKLFRNIYNVAGDFHDGVAVVNSKGMWGTISYSGQFIVEPKFGRLDDYENGLARCQLPAVYGLFTLEGKELVPVENDKIQAMRNSIFRIEKDNLVGYIDAKGRWRVVMSE